MTVWEETHSFYKHREDTLGNQMQDGIIKKMERYKGDRIIKGVGKNEYLDHPGILV